ncbi:MAG: tRNA-intron lyase [Candidatus Thorarchaeota archaeon]|nr:MAG: tRNA-intron lyase [Candidatus Thorarchaeota archaeon]RLI58415.1 MAG: tRNA-intron lyase [Candidatus Thorarchaeota archaeon]
MTDEPSSRIVAQLVGDRAIVWNPEHGSLLYSEGYFGQPVGIRKPKSPVFDKPLELSLIECAYLTNQGRLEVYKKNSKKPLSVSDILKIGKKISDEFKDRFMVYSHLRNKGYVVRPGLKFGTDFAVYEKGPGKDHAPFLVHVIPQRKGVVPLDIVRAGRLATSVRKKFMIATVKESGEIAYYSFVWHRP